MALAGGCGVSVEADAALPPLGWFFGEDQGRYLVATARPEALVARVEAAGVAARIVGRAGGERVTLGAGAVALETLRAAHEGALARLMGETPPPAN